jgi:5'-3' exonuclease
MLPSDAQTVVINGLDADLIILSLMNDNQYIYLMRENADEVTVLDVPNLRQAIVDEMMLKWDVNTDNTKDLIESYCVMCSLLGNDFIPHLLTLNLKSTSGLDKLIKYTGQAYQSFGLLVSNGAINYMALSDILQNIAKTEDQDIFAETKRYLTPFHNNKNMSKSDFYGLKNKDPLAENILASPSKWRQSYYKYLFYTNIQIDSSVINIACENYIQGIYWTYNYYKRRNTDNMWYYPYNYPPSVKDIANYTMCMTEPKNTTAQAPLDANMQMLIVLPRECKHLLDDKYARYIDDHTKGLAHLYPKKYMIHTYLKTHLWECCPELPVINVPYIIEILKPLKI